MNETTRIRLSYACTILALFLIVLGFVGMSQDPRPSWSRQVAVPALLLVLGGRWLRRGRKRES